MNFSKHSQGTTSVKVHNAPGGKSNFSLAWDTAEDPKQKVTSKPNTKPQPLRQNNKPTTGQTQKTSVKVHNPPGGRSNIIFG